MNAEKSFTGGGDSSDQTCVECHRLTPQTDMVQISGCWVCAGCKPIFLQRLAEGALPQALSGIAWRDGNRVVVGAGAELPDRCYKCNQPGDGRRLKRDIAYHVRSRGWLGILAVILLVPLSIAASIPIGLMIFFICVGMMSKRTRIHFALCKRHRRRRLLDRLAAGGGVVIGLLMMIVAARTLNILGIAIFAAVGIVSAVYAALAEMSPTLARMKDDFIWLKKAGREFLESLPEWPGQN